MIDEGTLLVLKSASGAFTCRRPLIPKKWNPVDRPHVARLVSTGTDILRVYLSKPKITDTAPYNLEVFELESLPRNAIIEVKFDSIAFNYYRFENGLWTKVAESNNPFMMEVFSHGSTPIVIDVAN
ncbi:MAG: hypothetical protein ACTSUO_10220 [Candidatus Thorarchaeota archaeon]